MAESSGQPQQDKRPSVSIVIPTLNSERTLPECLESIHAQDYPGRIEVVIADGGSTDKTLEIAREHGCKVLGNKLKTGEAGKAVGFRSSSGQIIALIDSDNILPDPRWLSRMTAPFENPEISGAEPIEFTYRKADIPLVRYFAMMGMGDPLCLFLKNYDRLNAITGRWTGLQLQAEETNDHIELLLTKEKLPTMGANGFLVKRELLETLDIEDYLFDIDIISMLIEKGHHRFAKVRTGIVHLYCQSLRDFARKQLRRITDYMYYRSRGMRSYPWRRQSLSGIMVFVLYCVTLVPLVAQAARGYLRKPDPAWLYHVPVCEITLVIYSYGFLKSLLVKEEQRRDSWKQ